MSLQFDQLNLHENNTNVINILFNQHIRNNENFSHIITYNSKYVVDNQNSSSSSLSIDTASNNYNDVVEYLTILNYVNDFKRCISSMNLDEHQQGQRLLTNLTMKDNIEECWEVYDSSGQCFCC